MWRTDAANAQHVSLHGRFQWLSRVVPMGRCTFGCGMEARAAGYLSLVFVGHVGGFLLLAPRACRLGGGTRVGTVTPRVYVCAMGLHIPSPDGGETWERREPCRLKYLPVG